MGAARGPATSSGSAGGAFRHRHSPGGADGKSKKGPGALSLITMGFPIRIAAARRLSRRTVRQKSCRDLEVPFFFRFRFFGRCAKMEGSA